MGAGRIKVKKGGKVDGGDVIGSVGISDGRQATICITKCG
jgi:hypothetical protein